MQTNILWSGIEYCSLENCIIDAGKNAVTVNAAMVGMCQEKLYRAEYLLELDNAWRIQNCFIRLQHNDSIREISLAITGKRWSLNGLQHPEWDDCEDVDIPLTPLTNSLPINRLRLKTGGEAMINVIYIDLLENEVRRVQQKYRRISADVYKYENVPNNFEALVTVDEDGFVINYPQLFERKHCLESNYPDI